MNVFDLESRPHAQRAGVTTLWLPNGTQCCTSHSGLSTVMAALVEKAWRRG